MSTHSLADFVQHTHSRGKQPIPDEKIGKAAAHELASLVDWSRMEEIAHAAHAYLPQVLEEIAHLERARDAHPDALKQRAFLFGISTPNRDERQSIAWALSVHPLYGYLSPHALANRTYTSRVTGKQFKIGMRQQLTSCLFAAQLQCIDCDHLSTLEALPGCGPKVARMIHAVANPRAKVWTVDLWHARQLLWAAGLEYRVRAAITKEAYAVLEEVWLNYAQAYFSSLTPTWAIQWATWCVANGRFESHAALWEDLAA
jgi:hypothetical protein